MREAVEGGLGAGEHGQRTETEDLRHNRGLAKPAHACFSRSVIDRIEINAPPNMTTYNTTHSRFTRRLHELDGLRAIACVLVVLHHTFTSAASRFLSAYSPTGAKLLSFATASGVECFFCLSGFILLYPYVRCGKPLNIPHYSLSRVRRIYPPFLVAWFFAGIVQFTITTFPTWYSNDATVFRTTDWLRQLNLLTLLECDNLYNGAWWSLAVECVWYMLVPFVVRASALSWPLRGAVVCMFFTVASIVMAFQINSFAIVPPNGFVGVARAVLSFLAFATCFASAVWLLVYAPRTSVVIAAGSVGFALIGYSGLSGDFRPIHAGFGLAWSAWIGLCMRVASLRKAMALPTLVWLGDRSYSLFLTHMTVFVFTSWAVSHWCSEKNWAYGVMTRAIGLPLALLVAMLLFWFVERHFSHRLETASIFWPPLFGYNRQCTKLHG